MWNENYKTDNVEVDDLRVTQTDSAIGSISGLPVCHSSIRYFEIDVMKNKGGIFIGITTNSYCLPNTGWIEESQMGSFPIKHGNVLAPVGSKPGTFAVSSSTGSKGTNSKWEPLFLRKFKKSDTIGCLLDLEKGEMRFILGENPKKQLPAVTPPPAFRVPKEKSYYPMVTLKWKLTSVRARFAHPFKLWSQLLRDVCHLEPTYNIYNSSLNDFPVFVPIHDGRYPLPVAATPSKQLQNELKIAHDSFNENYESSLIMKSLPVESLLQIFACLDLRDLLNTGMTCRLFHLACENFHVWNELYERHYHCSLQSKVPDLVPLQSKNSNNSFEDHHMTFLSNPIELENTLGSMSLASSSGITSISQYHDALYHRLNDSTDYALASSIDAFSNPYDAFMKIEAEWEWAFVDTICAPMKSHIEAKEKYKRTRNWNMEGYMFYDSIETKCGVGGIDYDPTTTTIFFGDGQNLKSYHLQSETTVESKHVTFGAISAMCVCGPYLIQGTANGYVYIVNMDEGETILHWDAVASIALFLNILKIDAIIENSELYILVTVKQGVLLWKIGDFNNLDFLTADCSIESVTTTPLGNLGLIWANTNSCVVFAAFSKPLNGPRRVANEILVSNSDGTQLFDLRSSKTVPSWIIPPIRNSITSAVSPSSEGVMIAIGNDAGVVKIYDIRSPTSDESSFPSLTAKWYPILHLSYECGSRLVTAQGDNSLRFWNQNTGMTQWQVQTSAPIQSLVCHDDIAAYGLVQGRVHILDFTRHHGSLSYEQIDEGRQKSMEFWAKRSARK